MALTNFPNGLSSFGMPLIGSGGVLTTGSVFFVHSGTGIDASGRGTDPARPFATIDYAIGFCTASEGDIIFVMPGHAETITAAAGIDADVAGISIIGIGNGTNKPTISFGTATTADIDIDAANITFRNLRFVSAIDSLAVMLDVNAAYFTCEDCSFYGPATLEVLNFINLATTIDNFFFRRCYFEQQADPAGTDGNADTGVFYFVDSENIFIEDCRFYGYFESAIFHNKTTAAKNVVILRCDGIQKLAGAEVSIQVAAMTGFAKDCGFTVEGSADVAEANTWGTMSDGFFTYNSFIGNDGAGGQLGVAGATAAS